MAAYCAFQPCRARSSNTRVDPSEHIADAGAAGDLVAAIAVAAAKARTGLLSQVLGPFADRLVAAHAAQHGCGGDGQHGRQGVAPSLRAARIGDIGEESREGTHVLGTQHHLRGSMVVGRVKDGLGQAGLGLGKQGAYKDPLGRLRPWHCNLAGTAKTARITHIHPIGGPVDGAVEIARIDEGLQ